MCLSSSCLMTNSLKTHFLVLNDFISLNFIFQTAPIIFISFFVHRQGCGGLKC